MRKYLLFIHFVLIVVTQASGQTSQDSVTAVILHLDSGFWNAYNRCDTAAFKNYLKDDVEFPSPQCFSSKAIFTSNDTTGNRAKKLIIFPCFSSCL